MAEVQKETEKKINQLQLFEQGMQNLLIQKQQFQSQIVEIDSALSELETSEKAYKIVGNIMVDAKKDELKKSLESKKGMVDLRIKTIEKQEKQIKEKSSKMQSEIVEEMKE